VEADHRDVKYLASVALGYILALATLAALASRILRGPSLR
jgi:hypothetical protein